MQKRLVKLLIICIINSMSAEFVFSEATNKGSITISPSDPYGKWSCSLGPNEDAHLTIEVEESVLQTE
jgi:hypothetical protein